jgi:peroxiredoxin
MKTFVILLCGLFTLQVRALSPEARKQLFNDSIEKLKSTGIEKQVPQIGQSFPDVHMAGKKVSDWVKSGPLLLVVYRGGWCPYCVKQLKDLQTNIEKFKAQKISLMAIAPETEQEVRKTKSKNNLGFPIVSDKDGTLLRKLGLIFRVDNKVAEEYKNLGINLAKNQGNSFQELPIPATYIIGKDLKVQYGHIDADYKNRPSVEETLKAIKMN